MVVLIVVVVVIVVVVLIVVTVVITVLFDDCLCCRCCGSTPNLPKTTHTLSHSHLCGSTRKERNKPASNKPRATQQAPFDDSLLLCVCFVCLFDPVCLSVCLRSILSVRLSIRTVLQQPVTDFVFQKAKKEEKNPETYPLTHLQLPLAGRHVDGGTHSIYRSPRRITTAFILLLPLADKSCQHRNLLSLFFHDEVHRRHRPCSCRFGFGLCPCPTGQGEDNA